MKWKNTALEILELTFESRVFNTKDAFRALNKRKRYSEGTTYRLLHDLCKEGFIERLGRGIYRIDKSVKPKESITAPDRLTVEPVPGPLAKAKELLRNKGIEFMITGGSVLHRYFHHLPKRLVHLVYVIKGAGEPAVALLREAGLRALLNPNPRDINTALENFPERDIFVIREFSELSGNINGNASIERALVDLYFESTRERTIFPEEEVGRIMFKVLKNEPTSISRLFMLASRRGIREEIEAIAKFVKPELPVKVKGENRHTKKVLKAMEAYK